MTIRRQRAPYGSHHALALALLMSVPCRAFADEPAFGPSDVPTVFFINKSDDHNRVDYGIRLAPDCTPVGKEPVFPYWREFEKAPPVRTHGLGLFEYFAYGISDQQLLRQRPGDAELQIKLKRLERPILIRTFRDAAGHCSAEARTTIAGVATAKLSSVFVQLKGPMSVSYLDVFGTLPDTGARIQERLLP